MVADPGPMLKRFRAASMGRASSIHKHTSHLTVELDVVKIDSPKQEPVRVPENAKAKKAKAVHPTQKKEAGIKEAAHKETKHKPHKK